jgi:protocatechuate 3,4-dioxygenase beta subunit
MLSATRTLRFALLAALLPAVASGQVAPPRDARPPAQAAAVGTATVTGTVTMAGGTQPARKVRVNLSGAELRGGRSVVTDDRGQFLFTALPAGRYSLSASKPGHVSVTYGQVRPGRPGTPIQLSDGQKFQADLQIPRGSVITGMVLDELGEPAPQTQVRVMRVVVQGGRRTLQGSNSATTDDRGIYRAFGLLPGDYVVCATPRNTNLGTIDRARLELQALQQSYETVARVDTGQARAIGERIAAVQAAMPQGDEEMPPGYSPVCYPGSISAATASPITLGISEERPGVDFQLQLAPLTRVEGTVVNSTGADVRNIMVTLVDLQQLGFSMGNITARADSEGRFRLMNVPPGQYRVTARSTVSPALPEGQAPAGGRGRGGRGGRAGGPGAEPITVWGAADITVDGRPITNLLLSLQQGISVSGQLAFDGATNRPADLTRIRVTMAPVGPTPFGGSIAGRSDASGRFTIPSVPPGLYRLSATGAPGWSIESASIGGQDALDFPVEVKGSDNLGSASITFTDRQTELTGIVTDERNQPTSLYSLIVFPADARYWTGTSRRTQTTRPATDGRYTFRNLPPGEYRLAPVFDVEPGSTSDPAYLQQLEATSLRVTLQPGETRMQDMRVGGG